MRPSVTKPPPLGTVETTRFWCDFNVTLHHRFDSAEDSLDFFHWRNDQYHRYIDYMPVSGQDGKVVLDFGCGPGHDMVGFGHYSRPKRLIGADLSQVSLAETAHRLALHGIEADLVQLDPQADRLPFGDGSIDHIHSSGVLHHTPDPVAIMREFRRILKPGGTINVMVYNHDSVWLHLYVGWQLCLDEGLYPPHDLRDAFRRSTDRDDCPISNCYTVPEFVGLAGEAGLEAELTGIAIAMLETRVFHHKRFLAIADRRWPMASRRFITGLTIDPQGHPMHEGHFAGIDACYRLRAPG